MPQTVEVKVPDLGGFADVPVIEVLIKAGDTIALEAPMVTLESDKATMEVPSSIAGTVREVLVKVGDKISQGTVLANIEIAGDAPAPSANGNVNSEAPSQPSKKIPSDPVAAKADLSSEPAEPTIASNASSLPITPVMGGILDDGATPTGPSSHPLHASPALRRFAREYGVDLAAVRGSGPNGRITREDVQSFVKTALTTRAGNTGVTSPMPGLLPWPKVDFASFGPIERKPLTRIQKLSGPNLARNWVMIPHVTQHEDADVTDLETFRKAINTERPDVKLTMLAFLMKAAVTALQRFPNFNSSLDGDELVLKSYYNIGFAADTPGGLLVPVIRDVDRKGVLEIGRETSELAAKARDGKLKMSEMQGATFTISSLGGIGGTYFTPIINAPEVAILGVCRASMRPVWDGSAFSPRLMLPLSLSYDHRVIDGASAARFAVDLAKTLADMRRTLL